MNSIRARWPWLPALWLGWATILALAVTSLGPAAPVAAQVPPGCTGSNIGSQVTITCDVPGTFTWIAPVGISSNATFDVYGAQGGSGSTGATGGLGGEAKASVSATPGAVFQLNVGAPGNGGGFPNGGNGGGSGGPGGNSGSGSSAGGGGGGGGASDV